MVSTRSNGPAEPTDLDAVTASPSAKRSAPRGSRGFQHAPTVYTLAWMAISLPLIVWDTVYVLARPHTMAGGSMHWPLWVPYDLYGRVDHVYGWKAFNAHSGFTAAQSFLNVVESLMYVAYMWMWYANGVDTAGRKTVAGRTAAVAVMLGFSAAVMTLSKTVLYWANEYFSGFDNIGHNTLYDLIVLWILPNGAWLVGSTYMIWSIGGEIIDNLSGGSRPKSE